MFPQFPGKLKRGVLLVALVVLAGCAAQRHHRNGLSAYERKDYPKAVAELQKAVELTPGDVIYRRDWIRAKEESIETLFGAAQLALGDNDRKLAERNLRSILQFDRDNARALAGLERLELLARADSDAEAASAALKAGDTAKAAEVVARALKAAPSHTGAQAVRREIDELQAKEVLLEPSLGALYKKPINLEFRDASIRMVFDALSRSTGINFIFDRDVKTDQRTTVFLKQTSLEDAINVILSTGQLEKKVLNSSSVLIYPNSASKLREYQDLVVRAFYLSNVEAKQAASLLKTVLKIKDPFVDDKYNMIVLREPPETVALAEKLIRLHDLEEPEVMLEVEVLEINRSRLLNAGIQWNSAFSVTPTGVSKPTTGQGSTAPATMTIHDLRNLTSEKLGITVPSATINLQKMDGDANLLANPRIRVRDREKAKVMIGDKVPVVTTTSTNNFVTENIQYLDVGLKLEVEPDIHLRDEIGLKISMEVSSLVSSVKTNNGSQAYQIGTRNFNSTLRLKDGETQVLAGLINDEDRMSANRVPLLGDLPILGRLFGSQNDNRQKTEIVLSITPHLIRNMQRKDPSLESFWSGTEASIRNRPLLLREMKPGQDADPAVGGKPAAGTAPGSNRSVNPVVTSPPGAPKLTWIGPRSAKVGEIVELSLDIDSADSLRATSLQFSYQPAEFEIVAVDDGQYFGKDGKGAFSKTIDAAGGRISIGASAPDGAPRKGTGRLVALKLRALKEVTEASVGLIALTPVGAEKAIPRPGIPVLHLMDVSR
ncbi:cohesin domain-containing protein [Pseudoduganella sp.]|uniref:cohesin domain-containing protein n=1 Tax=Pseudoduganella sp. TaxID=1880898 RepID=UPI0035B04702